MVDSKIILLGIGAIVILWVVRFWIRVSIIGSKFFNGSIWGGWFFRLGGLMELLLVICCFRVVVVLVRGKWERIKN